MSISDFRWTNNFGYYYTYYGVIHYGIAICPDMRNDEFYILTKKQFVNNFMNLSNDEKKAILEKNAIYIKNEAIIDLWEDEKVFKSKYKYSETTRTNINQYGYRRMFIFGAGATANMVHHRGQKEFQDSEFKPPLGIELFDKRYDTIIRNYPGIKSLIPKYEFADRNVETLFENDWEQITSRYNLRLTTQHIQVQYYLKDLFYWISENVLNNFYRYNLLEVLIEKIFQSEEEFSKPAFVSFNYDIIVDKVIENYLGIKLDKITSYNVQGEDNQFVLFKPHGSCNWGWKFNVNKLNADGINNNGHMITWLHEKNVSPAMIYYDFLDNDDMVKYTSWGIEEYNNPDQIGKYIPNRDKIEVVKDSDFSFPALLLPYRDKDEFVMPYDHQFQLDQILADIEEIVIIGWKGSEAYFNRKLKKAKKLKKIVVANLSIDNVKKELSNYIDSEAIEWVHFKGLEDYVQNGI